jgi:hypothetical protein
MAERIPPPHRQKSSSRQVAQLVAVVTEVSERAERLLYSGAMALNRWPPV